MSTSSWKIIDERGNLLGRVEKYRIMVGPRYKRLTRVWYRNVNDHSVNADKRSLVAHHIANGNKFQMIAE